MRLVVLLLSTLALFACKQPLKPELLHGKWNYTHIKELNNSPDSVTRLDLEIQKPSIEFRRDGLLEMMWGGRLLSRGTYTIEGDEIVYREQLADGKTRTFPFVVTKLDEKEIVFATTDRNGARVTARKAGAP